MTTDSPSACAPSLFVGAVGLRGQTLASKYDSWRPDWLAGLRGLELRNDGPKYRFEMSRGFSAIQPKLGREGLSEVSDDMRELVEEEWPELVHKLPPKILVRFDLSLDADKDRADNCSPNCC